MFPIIAAAAAFGAASVGGNHLGTTIVSKVLPTDAPAYPTVKQEAFDMAGELHRLFPEKY
jgi:hypothetical protein